MKLCCLVLFCLVLPPMLSATPQATAPTEDYSGMYSFLKDGEFIQITIEEKGAVSGFI